MALSANTNVNRVVDDTMSILPVGAAVHIYQGALVGIDPAGYAKAFVPGDVFVGVAYEESDNSSGAAAAKNVRVFIRGDFEYTLTSVAETDKGKPAYATADDAIALTGHPDAYVGRVLRKSATNTAVISLKAPGEVAPNGIGSQLITLDNTATFEGLAAAGSKYHPNGFLAKAVGAAGAPVVAQLDAENGGLQLAFSTTAEVQTASFRQANETLPVDKGITMEADVTVHDNGDTADGDFDFGLGTALTTNSEADIDHPDMVQLAAFHCDGNDENIDCQSDNNTTDVAPVDSTVDNVADTYARLKIIVRPTGAVEFWIDGARVLSTTTFAVLSTAVLAPFINLEKGANDTPGAVYIKNLRIGGGIA